MAIYKPTNCHPFADAIDITKTFLTIEPQGDGTWDWNKPEPVYFTCKLETNNLPVIGYKIRVYINGERAFPYPYGGTFSPVCELPKFKEDPTINSGVNGTYLAIPVFQYGVREESMTSHSDNSIYFTGENQLVGSDGTQGIKADYLISYYIPDTTDLMTGEDSSAGSGWHFVVGSGGVIGYYDYTGWDGTLNGGHLVTKNDVIFVSGTSVCNLCRLSDDGKRLKVEKTYSVTDQKKAVILIAKGKYNGLYMYGTDSSPVRYYSEINWGDMFKGYESTALNPQVNKAAFAGFGDSQMSWDIDLLQGPEDYQSLLAGDDPDYFENELEDIPLKYYDMKIASGTILGSCAKRLHLSSVIDIDGEYLLPGENKKDPVVLQGTYCELYYAQKDGDNPGGYSASHKMVPSFPIASFDSSLGLVYPKEYSMSEGGLTQGALESFLASIPQDTPTEHYGLFARFFKYSSNAEDVLSNEKVRAAYWDLSDSNIDPRIYLRSGAVVDGVEVKKGDRVLWNTLYGQGCYNGIWVVEGEGEEPSRPADGNEYSDYIGKVTLIVEGSVYAATVAESNASSGGNYDLGQMPFFFREQSPIVLFDYEPTGNIPSTNSGYASEAIVNETVENYLWSDGTGGVRRSVLPVVYPDGHVLICSNRITDSEGRIKGLYYLELDDGYIQVSNQSATGYFAYKYGYDPYLNAGVYDQASFNSAKQAHTTLYVEIRNGVFRVQATYNPMFEMYYYKGAFTDNTIYIKGEDISNSAIGKTFSVLYGTNANQLFLCPRIGVLTPFSPQTSALVLFNEENETYVSPTSQILNETVLSLRGGAKVTYGGKETGILPIGQQASWNDKKFNRVRHAALASPLPAAPDAAAVPPTPYKYDILSCFRTSDQNAFASVPPLTPHIEPSDQNGLLEGGYSVFADASCFQGEGKAWNSARLILPGVSLEDSQDTFWFSSKGLDAEFAGLEPGNSYEAILYAKDSDGRTTSEKRGIYVPPDTDEYIQMSRFYMEPSFTFFEGSGSRSYRFYLRFYADQYSLDASNMDEYFQTVSVSSTGAGGIGTYDTSSSNEWSISTVDGKSILQLKLYAATTDVITTGEMNINVSMDSPVGRIYFRILVSITGHTSSGYTYGVKSSTIASPATPQVFTGVFPGELTAESDCSTQSVVLTYKPAGGYDSWPDGLPLDQNGTYDVFRREYSDFKKSASCGYDNPLSPAETETWYGEWEPAILHTDDAVMRDFNVKQGHSYQYAIFPRRQASLKVEREFMNLDEDADTTHIGTADGVFYVRVGFDNTIFDIPYDTEEPWEYGGPVSVSVKNASGASISTGNPFAAYCHSTETGAMNGYIEASDIGSSSTPLEYPITVDISLNRLGMTLKARVIFTSDTEYTVEPFDGSYGWRRRLLANGGEPVFVQWDAWSLVELEEADPDDLVDDPLIRHPYVRKAYKADLDKIWLFRYDAEPGSQSINLTKGEISTLGRYTRFSSGNLNAESGEMSAWLGSEVVPGTRLGYIERRRKTIWAPMATNEAAARLAEFRAMVASDKPKLLRDRKGRSWIVQVSGGSSSTQDNFVGTPTKISFSWKEIAASGPYVVISGEGDELPPIDEESEWKPNIIFSASH